MNRYAYLLREIFECNTITQRELAEKLNLSLGSINSLIKDAMALNYLYKEGSSMSLTESGLEYLLEWTPSYLIQNHWLGILLDRL